MMTKMFAKGALATALVAGVVASSSYGCDEPPPGCAASRLDFFVILTPASAGQDASCAMLTSDTFGISTYNPESTNSNKPNLNVASVAIQSMALGTEVATAAGENAVDPDPTHKLYALGFFSTAAPVNDFCTVPTLTTAIQNIPGYPADTANMVTAAPPTSISYTWSNVRFYVTADHLGGQMLGDVSITTDGVKCDYTAIGISPAVACGKADPNDPTGMNMIPDPTACEAAADEDAGRSTGSGINSDYPVVCDPKYLECILSKPIPALN